MQVDLNEIETKVDGRLYKYYDIGNSDRVLVFLHGLTGSKEDQPKFYERLIPEFRCIFLDLPAHNNLPLYNINSLYGFAEYFISFINHLNLKKFGLVGFSLGGLISLKVSEEFYNIGKNVPAIIWSSPININGTTLSGKANLTISTIGYLSRNVYLSILKIDFIYNMLKKLGIVLLRHDKNALLNFNNKSMTKISKIFKEKTDTNFGAPLLFIFCSRRLQGFSHP